ncbi:MAG: hypothetical protein JW987_13465 [Anaerolineaceae bacterium]|nr:hypothetical protein [Anaerolineaceae bacterium]
MEYKPSELADELGVTTATIYNSWIPSGLPARCDDTGHFWIVGTDLKTWLESTIEKGKAKSPEHVVGENDFFCRHCNSWFEASDFRRKPIARKGVYLKIATCPLCERNIGRFASLGGKK